MPMQFGYKVTKNISNFQIFCKEKMQFAHKSEKFYRNSKKNVK